MQTVHTLGVKRRVTGSKNGRGNPVITWGETLPWAVYAYSPGAAGSSVGSDEPSQGGRDLSLILWAVYSPAGGNAPTELDRVVLDGDEYEVEGRPADWTFGPHTHPSAGLVVELKRAEG